MDTRVSAFFSGPLSPNEMILSRRHSQSLGKRMVKHATRLVLGCMSWMLCQPGVQAHDPGLSVAKLRIEDGTLWADLTFALADIQTLQFLDVNGDGRVTVAEFQGAHPSLDRLARDSLRVRIDGRSMTVNRAEIRFDTSQAVHFRVVYSLSPHGGILSVNSVLVNRLAFGHRQYVSVRDRYGTLLGERILAADRDVLQVDLTRRSPERGQETSETSLPKFLLLGIEHILAGYDHLLFLFGLLIASCSMRSAVKIITSFTIAHSLTLLLAASDFVQIRSEVVEPLIALSIVYVGLENIFRSQPRHPWLLTFGLGLIHGFGFATSLRELGVYGSEALILRVLSFNLGVEIGQLAVMSWSLPLIFGLRKYTIIVNRVLPACSVGVIVIGGYWFVHRILP